MKIIFFGTPDFAIPSLTLLNESNHEIVAVVTTPDKKSGRGLKIKKPPVKIVAESIPCDIIQPNDFKDDNFLLELKKHAPDLFIVVAFKKLPNEVLSIPIHGSINLHASLLPKYRGAAPIYHAILNGEAQSGITTFMIESKIDTGMILLQEKCKISSSMNAGELHDKLSQKGASLLLKTIDKIKAKTISPQIQNHLLSTKAPKIKKNDQIINWNSNSSDIHNQIRALSPYPGAITMLNDKKIKIYSSKVINDSSIIIAPGLIKINSQKLYVGTKNGSIQINEIQFEGKNKLTVDKFINGQKHINGIKFG